MIHLLYGEDTLSLDEKLAALRAINAADDLYDVNSTTIDGASASLIELEMAWSAAPFLADKRIVVVRGLLARFEPRRGRARGASSRGRSKAAAEWDGLGDRLAHAPPSTELIFVDGSVARNNTLFRAISKVAEVHRFALPSAREMPQWVRERADKMGAAIEPRAIAALTEAIGNDTRLVDMELQKLALYRSGQRIRRQDVEALVSYAKEANIFAAVDAALEGRAGAALRMKHQLMEAGSSPIYLITMIARQVRFLILAKDLKSRGLRQDEIGERMSLRGYPLTKTLQQEGRFSAQQLVGMHRRLLEADLSIKTGAADEQTALDTLIVALAEPGHAGQRRR